MNHSEFAIPDHFPSVEEIKKAQNRGLTPRSEALTAAELEAIWRWPPDLIGPVAPPMWLWARP